MAVADPDLDQFRHDLAALIGVPVSDVGMLPDQGHLAGGGYHCGRHDLISIGKFHPPALAHVGSSGEDYSVRQLRDRNAVNDRAAAVDEPDGWGNGGNAAWIRANNAVLAAMQTGDPALAALRAMNFTPDGKVKRRYDTNNRDQGVIASTDTVLWHTHWEFWRDTLGTPVLKRTLARLLEITRAAIAGRPVPPPEEDDDMGATYIDGHVKPAGQVTNVNLGIVEGGAADPRPAWLAFTNDGPGDYALRVVWTAGDNNYQPLSFAGGKDGQPGTQPVNAGYDGTIFRKGWRGWVSLPAGCVEVAITRQGIAGGKPVKPTADSPAADWDLGFSIERGAVKK